MPSTTLDNCSTQELGQRYAGILTDGCEWRLYSLAHPDDELREVATLIVDPQRPDVGALLVWLESVLSTVDGIEPTHVEVERRLGATAPGTMLDLAELADIYRDCRQNPEVEIKRELWARLLAGAFGSQFVDDETLFLEHTYLVLVAEVVAHAIMGIDVRAGGLSSLELVTGVRFRESEISGVVEADFFDWPVHTERGQSFIEALARRVGRFNWGDVEHDVLKALYESVIDRATRHQLGEYYTPDWLAERIVAETIDNPLEQRVLEPACGSGSFLFWAVRRYLEAAEASGVSNRDALNGVLDHVFGVDLHPVAVTLARVTYLMAIGTKRLKGRDPIRIPVYLGDSIQFNQSTSVLSGGAIRVLTTRHTDLQLEMGDDERELCFPHGIVSDPTRFDQLVDELATRASKRNRDGEPPSIETLMNNHEVEDESDREMIRGTYRAMCSLYDAGRDHIWGYYVRNLTRPIDFARPEGRVDRLVGNPPWLRYNAMTAEMQTGFRRLARDRQLQAPAHVATSQDLGGLFAARCIEQYLRVGGRFGFVLPGSALSRAQYQRFRAGDFSSSSSVAAVAFDKPWDLSRLDPEPFPVPASVVFGTRVDARDKRAMPELASWWSGSIDHTKSWQQLEDLFAREDAAVVVADGHYEAPYASVVRQGANLVPRVLVTVKPRDLGPLGDTVGKLAVESDRSSPEKAPWKSLDELRGSVEPQFVRRMLLGESLLPFVVRGERLAVVPITPAGRLLTLDDAEMDEYPGLQDWWSRADDIYRTHAPETTRHDLTGQVNYQGKLEAQVPAEAHRVAYTGRGARVTAAVVRDADVIVDHALYWAAFPTDDEAVYVATVINSEIVHAKIDTALSRGQFGARNIHRAPFLVPWAEYDATDAIHRSIVEAGRAAEGIAANIDSNGSTASARKRVRAALSDAGIEQTVDGLVKKLLAPRTAGGRRTRPREEDTTGERDKATR